MIIQLQTTGIHTVKNDLVKQLRDVIQDIRRKPYPIKDLIPLLASAADEIENLQRVNEYEIDVCGQALETISKVAESCNNRLRSENKPYPRTCKLCGFGPKCKLE